MTGHILLPSLLASITIGHIPCQSVSLRTIYLNTDGLLLLGRVALGLIFVFIFKPSSLLDFKVSRQYWSRRVLSDTDRQGICPPVMEANKDGSKMCVVTWLDLCFAKMAPNFSPHKHSAWSAKRSDPLTIYRRSRKESNTVQGRRKVSKSGGRGHKIMNLSSNWVLESLI